MNGSLTRGKIDAENRAAAGGARPTPRRSCTRAIERTMASPRPVPGTLAARAGLVRPVEAVEDVRQLVLGNPGPVSATSTQPNRRRSPTRTSTRPRSVNLMALSTRLPTSCRSRLRIADDDRRAACSKSSAMPFSAARGAAFCDHFAGDLREREGSLGISSPRSALASVSMPLTIAGEIGALARDRLQALAADRPVSVAPAQQHLRVGVDRRERRLEFVRRIGDELPLACEGLFETREQVVEALRRAGRSRRAGGAPSQAAAAGAGRSRSGRSSRISRESSLIGVVACAASTIEKKTTAAPSRRARSPIASLRAGERALERVERLGDVDDGRGVPSRR